MKNGSKLMILGLFGIAITFSGCANNNSEKAIINKFEINEYTIHSKTEIAQTNDYQTQGNNEDKDNQMNTSSNVENAMGELILNNKDTSVTYEVINGTDVKYKGVTYVNLYTCVNSLNTKYDKNTVINFIIKNIKGLSNTVYCDLSVDNATEGEEIFSIDEELSGREKYESLKNRYNEPATWALTLVNSEDRSFKVIFGSYSYMLLSGVDGDVVLDMSEQDSGININEAPINNSESISEETTENIDETQQVETTEQVEATEQVEKTENIGETQQVEANTVEENHEEQDN